LQIFYSSQFKKDYKRLSTNDKKQFKRKIKLLESNPRHPSLRTKKVQGTGSIFESTINMGIRMTWQFTEDGIYLRNIGLHDKTLNNP
jgi:mRNA-degrading endonuclease YafQ of YafQ-DinJ toxin-antitoxin module